MFFSIGHEPASNFSHHWRVGDFSVSTDAGWASCTIRGKTVVFKGYCESAPLTHILEQVIADPKPVAMGNYCVIAGSGNELRVHHDLYRSFPIYVTDSAINNLVPSNKTIWSNAVISVDKDLSVTETKFNAIGEIYSDSLTYSQVLSAVMARLDDRIEQFLSNNPGPIKVHLSGGVDSLLVYSFLRKQSAEHELVTCSHIDYDEFWLKNSGTIQQHWGYQQIHHWIEPSVLASGAPGDEFMLRNPVISARFLAAHGYRIQDLLQQDPWTTSMHAEFFNKDVYRRAFRELRSQTSFGPTLILSLCNEVINDWQHWHLGNTLTWTPLRDLEIFKLILRLPARDALGQIFDSQLSKAIIETNCPGLTRVLSDQKNTGNVMANLADFLLAQ